MGMEFLCGKMKRVLLLNNETIHLMPLNYTQKLLQWQVLCY